MRPIPKSISIGLALLVSLTLLFFIAQILLKTESSQSRGPAIATLSGVTGEVLLRKSQAQTQSSASNGTEIFSYDQIATGPASQATLKFKSGGELAINENVNLIAEIESGSAGRVSVTVVAGDVQISEASENLRVFKNGVEITSAGTEASAAIISSEPSLPNPVPSLGEPSVTVAGPDEITTPAPTPPKTLPKKNAGGNPSERLTNEEISRVLAGQGSRFQRCYLGFLQRRATDSTETTGKVVVAFELTTDGEVRGAKVVSSPFNDQTLNSCLLEVVNRARFPAFAGEKIVISEFPITLQ